ncbi:MAG: hypothetical protein H0X25_07110 [Acidobacteriales bacterium]|nr:hypothetical protein [Terriglobales bacterium]
MAAGVVASGALRGVPVALAKTSSVVPSSNDAGTYASRVQTAYNLRVNRAAADQKLPIPPHTTNGDEDRYTDKSASYSKGLKQDGICLVNKNAWISFKTALKSAKMSDWENVIIGGTATLNGPQGAYAYDLEAADSVQYVNAPFGNDPGGLAVVPPFDTVTSSKYGAQLIEMYWASLLRDVDLSSYTNNSTAQAAATELGSLGADYRGPRDASGNVTPNLLFRGTFPGLTIEPYISQFFKGLLSVAGCVRAASALGTRRNDPEL